MERFVDDNLAVHLGPRYEVVENAVALYGVDHQSEWADHVLDIEDAPDGLETILCVHQSVAPFTASTNPDCLLGDIEAATSGSMDVILTGHVHTRLERRSTTSHGLSGGATTRVGEDRGELQPSVELISSGAMDPQRHYL
jgi:exonuclease SbcD